MDLIVHYRVTRVYRDSMRTRLTPFHVGLPCGIKKLLVALTAPFITLYKCNKMRGFLLNSFNMFFMEETINANFRKGLLHTMLQHPTICLVELRLDFFTLQFNMRQFQLPTVLYQGKKK